MSNRGEKESPKKPDEAIPDKLFPASISAMAFLFAVIAILMREYQILRPAGSYARGLLYTLGGIVIIAMLWGISALLSLWSLSTFCKPRALNQLLVVISAVLIIVTVIAIPTAVYWFLKY